MNKFRELGLSDGVVSVLGSLNFEEPTDIQRETIPLILKGRDVIGNAATGSGKTFAFVSGIIEKTIYGKGVQALVLTPTRELADQILKVTREFSKNTKLRSVEIFGGMDIRRQISELKGCEIVIGTPGRILDLLKRRELNLSGVTTLVLDEADRMVDMGFINDVEKIISYCPKQRQTLLFSATTSATVKSIEKKHLIHPVTVTVETRVDPKKLKQSYYDVPFEQKFSLLAHLLKKEKSGIAMVFCNTRRIVDRVARNLEKNEIKCRAIHGGLEQNRRNRIIKQFHDKEAEILICTNVAARGLDIKGVTHVYNYDLPSDSEEYIHRIGRTARAGEEGEAISLVSNTDYANFSDVINNLGVKIEKKELPEFQRLFVEVDKRRRLGSSEGRGGRHSGSYGRSRSSGYGSKGSSFRGRSSGYSKGGFRGGAGRSSSYGRSRGSSSGRGRTSSSGYGGGGSSGFRRGGGFRRGNSSGHRKDDKFRGRY